MSWAGQRRAGIAFGIVAVLASLTALSWYVFLYEPPSCFDRIQNQDELGIDCDGVCTRMCVAPRTDAVWTRAVRTADGVYHGVSLVKNPLPNVSGTDLTYVLSLYDRGNILVAERRGSLALSPGETRIVFEPNIITGERVPVRALLKIDGGTWARAEAEPSTIRMRLGQLSEETRTLTAELENLTATPIENVVADALLYDSDGILVTASETRIDVLPARGRYEAVFTWPEPFERPVVTSDVIVRTDARP
jgi:hypothetical protein